MCNKNKQAAFLGRVQPYQLQTHSASRSGLPILLSINLLFFPGPQDSSSSLSSEDVCNSLVPSSRGTLLPPPRSQGTWGKAPKGTATAVVSRWSGHCTSQGSCIIWVLIEVESQAQRSWLGWHQTGSFLQKGSFPSIFTTTFRVFHSINMLNGWL